MKPTPEDSRGANFLAEGIEGKGRNDGADFTACGGDTVSKGTVTCREDFSGVALRKPRKEQLERTSLV